jgi:hypothetical protein
VQHKRHCREQNLTKSTGRTAATTTTTTESSGMATRLIERNNNHATINQTTKALTKTPSRGKRHGAPWSRATATATHQFWMEFKLNFFRAFTFEWREVHR